MRIRHQRRQQQRFCAMIEMLEERRLLTSVVVNSLSDATSLPNGLISLRDGDAARANSTAPRRRPSPSIQPSSLRKKTLILLGRGGLGG